MKRLIARSTWKILIMTFILVILTSIFSALYPIINNNIAMTQFENDDFTFAAFQIWQNVSKILYIIKWTAISITGISIVIDVINYSKTRKEN